VKATARAALAPPGYYLLFIVDGRGVPSVAKIVRIG
jgi:galactose oxidase